MISEDISKLMADTKPKIQETQRTPSRINIKVSMPGHIIFKLQKTKDGENLLKKRKINILLV